MTELALAFMAGLAGSAHCLGMCGGLVAALAVTTPGSSHAQRFMLTLAYHLGRIATYTLLGIVVGAASQGALLTRYTFLFNLLFLVANLAVVLIGLATAAGLPGISLARLDGTPWGGLGRILAYASRSALPLPYLGAGLLMGLLPCGLVYGVLLTAAGSGSWVAGGSKMLAFGVGTLPALMLYGEVAGNLRASFGQLFLRLMGGVVALLGLMGIAESLVRMGIIPPIVLPW